ncbi:uncharacterized protein LOC134665986 isoform X2 [Cydia fagiglandana]|uniref:uncharacterized protein LOC134665986 isoform X2 n=1 Tax=Cydia fagiglandana TaxID=1458189 RepID=UPI002FEE4DBA
MRTISVQQPINLKVVKIELDFTPLDTEPQKKEKPKQIIVPKINYSRRPSVVPPPPPITNYSQQKRDVRELVQDLLDDLYADQRGWGTSSAIDYCHASTSAASLASSQSLCNDHDDSFERSYLEGLDVEELQKQAIEWEVRLRVAGERLARCVRVRDRYRRQQKRLCAAFTVLLRHITGETGARFGLTPSGSEGPGEGGYAEWLHAMRLVARLPAGVPTHFRKKLWITLADRHLTARGIDWPVAERACFRGTAQPDDTELGAQIIKDLHRTGCSLFCGTEGRENQAMLRRVLLAYARWNKDVGYCQGFNMLAAIILEVMDKSESDSLKVMIYLVEAVLPEGYFADDLRGLSADMAAFRDLLRLRLPRLANHMDHLQRISDGGGVEPPLPDVFTMQWFLTLYATWLPRESLLRIWDLILLDGNEILLLTALAIWDMLQDRILSARSADEFYSCMGGGAGAVWEAGEALVARVVAFGSVPELPRLRSLHRYRVTPPAPPAPPVCQPPLHSAMQSMTKRGLRLFYSEDEGDSSDDGNKMALATVIPRRDDRLGAGDRLSLDIGALKRQYARLRERQRQAHVILAAACARHAAVGVPTSPTSLTVNNLLLGKSAIVSSRGRRLGPPPGAVPPSRQALATREKTSPRAHSNETISWNEEKSRKSISRRNSVKWKDIKKDKTVEKGRKASIDFDEAGDGIIVSEREADEMIATLRSRSSSESSSYSSHSASSTDTSLCDDNERGSDSEPEIKDDNKVKVKSSSKEPKYSSSPLSKDTVLSQSPSLKESKISPSCFSKDTYVRSPSIKETQISPCTLKKDTSFHLSPMITESKPSPCKFTKDTEYLHSPISKESTIISPAKDKKNILPSVIKESITTSSKEQNQIMPSEMTVNDYLHSAAGELLRNYIDGFDSKRSDNLVVCTEVDNFKRLSPYKNKSPYSDHDSEKGEVLMRLKSEEYTRSTESIRSSVPSKNLTDLSPIDLSPCNFETGFKSPYTYDYESNFKRPSTSKLEISPRPPDIIDSLTMYPNFVPDIDLSDKNVSDIDSPPRSPGAESIVVSEDEPPIPLRIDKYFEHSPEFFGARVTDPNNSEIPNRRAAKRLSRVPKKPDSLTLQSNHNEKNLQSDVERASSLPQSHSFSKKTSISPDINNQYKMNTSEISYEEHSKIQNIKQDSLEKTPEVKTFSPKDYVLQSGRKNSERALQIIQENSKILSRILTKQNMSDITTKTHETKSSENLVDAIKPDGSEIGTVEPNFTDCSFLKESTSDSLIVHRKKNVDSEANEKNDFVRIRPISIDDPFSLEIREGIARNPEFSTLKCMKSPSSECLGNKTDHYGWENKGFLAKCDFKNLLNKPEKYEFNYTNTMKTPDPTARLVVSSNEPKRSSISEWAQNSGPGESKASVTLPSSSEIKDTSTYERRFISDEYNYPLSTKYNDFVLSKASDICSKTVGQGPKICDSLIKTDNSQVSEFANVVTSSISFTYEPSADDDSPCGAKSNSSDTLCQIASLDQVSTPISPKIFPNRETPTNPKDYLEKSDKFKLESDDTCSAITSLIETDTLSSLSYPRSPSTGSYHPFPTRPAMRMPKELGVRLGMYPKDTVNSPPK